MPQVMPLRDSRLRAERAFGLRAIGRTWREVCNELGYKSVGAAQLAVSRHMARMDPESVDTTRRGALESLRITTSVLFDRFAAAVVREDDNTVVLLNREIVRNRDQLARLTGAYTPERTEVDVTLTQASFIESIRTRAVEMVDARAAVLPAVDAEVVEP
jgi:hypothetical protein